MTGSAPARKKEHAMKGKEKKLCFIASSGGHLEQIMMLRPMMARHPSFIVTEKTLYKAPTKDEKVYFLPQVNRKEWKFPFLMIGIAFRSLGIFIKEKPDVVITTGALAVVPLCLLAKLFRKKLIYIESFARITSPNLTGKLLYKYADQFYVQWESMLKVYPKAIYLGGIY